MPIHSHALILRQQAVRLIEDADRVALEAAS
jgi:hypothetical protein